MHITMNITDGAESIELPCDMYFQVYFETEPINIYDLSISDRIIIKKLFMISII